ncbi:hypothetical protein LC653_21180 [Nostoc sp. CHAB 5784]|uniref:hypothetical protein n=1 Tax=Nostoc mirabile TaxID=2907820 RepID=UPI001E51347C|nr:hypothetical protein [Nostoc mirabile]MCC5666361.1 hypothetical protein [Nostoc mirabile CHAB5784]
MTEPVRPTKIQRTLYGEILYDYILVELIALPLLTALKEKPNIVIVQDEILINVNQKHEYEKALDIGRIQLETSIQTESDFQVRNNIFKLIGNLKKICNFASGQSTSPKSELLIEYIETIAANGEKVLVFSQYKQEGINKIETLLNQQKIGFVSYKGEMSVQQRNNAGIRRLGLSLVFHRHRRF